MRTLDHTLPSPNIKRHAERYLICTTAHSSPYLAAHAHGLDIRHLPLHDVDLLLERLAQLRQRVTDVVRKLLVFLGGGEGISELLFLRGRKRRK